MIRFLPLILFVVLAIVLYRGLSLNPQELPSALIGKPVPAFNLSSVKDKNAQFTAADLKGEIVLLNVWGTWCPGCRVEHPYLLDLAKSDRFTLYGVNYKDERSIAREWLDKLGDPYVFSLFDEMGSLGLNLGVYGAPETFIIDHHGLIRMRYAGIVDSNSWAQKFEPVVKMIEQEIARGE
ncbi:DsbE family thiol:disulfide interchange protein [Thalassotalea agarivorans]|nr:DsbE family thiol:disulfide interchange protein [Thalassotalea agarivorans]